MWFCDIPENTIRACQASYYGLKRITIRNSTTIPYKCLSRNTTLSWLSMYSRRTLFWRNISKSCIWLNWMSFLYEASMKRSPQELYLKSKLFRRLMLMHNLGCLSPITLALKSIKMRLRMFWDSRSSQNLASLTTSLHRYCSMLPKIAITYKSFCPKTLQWDSLIIRLRNLRSCRSRESSAANLMKFLTTILDNSLI